MGISIHALLAESDSFAQFLDYCDDISIHALLAESDSLIISVVSSPGRFLSTLSLRRATKTQWALLVRQLKFLSTLSLRRATRQAPPRFPMTRKISIHALLAESDHQQKCRDRKAYVNFYPRSPCGERPYYMQWDITDTVISIHALLAESDRRHRRLHPVPYQDFYPRSPCGERQQYKASSVLKPLFLSTLSLRRATVTVLGIQHRVGISIHALLAESDKRVITRNTLHELFLSTLSLRRATSFMLYDTSSLIFLSTLSLRRATVAPVLEAGGSRYFYPRSPCGERH